MSLKLKMFSFRQTLFARSGDCDLSGRAARIKCPCQDCHSLHSKIQFWWIEMKLEPSFFLHCHLHISALNINLLSFFSEFAACLFIQRILIV